MQTSHWHYTNYTCPNSWRISIITFMKSTTLSFSKLKPPHQPPHPSSFPPLPSWQWNELNLPMKFRPMERFMAHPLTHPYFNLTHISMKLALNDITLATTMWIAIDTSALLASSPIQDISPSIAPSTIWLQDHLLPPPLPLKLVQFPLPISLSLTCAPPMPLPLVVGEPKETNIPPLLLIALLHLIPPLHMTMITSGMTLPITTSMGLLATPTGTSDFPHLSNILLQCFRSSREVILQFILFACKEHFIPLSSSSNHFILQHSPFFSHLVSTIIKVYFYVIPSHSIDSLCLLILIPQYSTTF